ncbi:MAG: hypothetical protein RLZZ464_1551 [Pseudomonadota bacterium]|jgi:hypothetical protein
MNTTHTPAPSIRLTAAAALLSAFVLAGCAGMGGAAGTPVLYPNAAYKAMGEAAARQHLDQCVALAQSSGLSPVDKNSSVGSNAAMGAAVAGVSGAVTGLVFGHGNLNDAVKYGAQSAVVGAAAGGTRGAMSQQPSGSYRNFVQRCAGEKGLDVIGWQ